MHRSVQATLLVFCWTVIGSATTLATTWNVPGDFPSIQSAIDGATAGDSISIGAGEYQENLVISKSLALIGAGVGSTILYPAVSDVGTAAPPSFGHSQLAVVQATNVTIQAMTLDGDSPYLTAVGVLDARNGIITNYNLGNWSGLTVRSCQVRNIYLRAVYATPQSGTLTDIAFIEDTVNNVRGWAYQSAAYMFYNAQGQITHCTAMGSSLGIMLQAGSSGTLVGNTIDNCTSAIAVNSNTGTVTVLDNFIMNYGDTGFQSVEPGAALIVRRNEISTRIEPGSTDQAAIYVFSQKTGNLETQLFENNILRRTPLPARGTKGILRPQMAMQATPPLRPVGARLVGWGLVVDTYGWSTSHDVHAVIIGNTFEGFESGVLLVDTHSNTTPVMDVVIGGGPGESNLFRGSTGYELALQSQNDDIDARYNHWGATWPSGVEDEIYHQADDPTLGLVDYSEWLGGGVGVEDGITHPAVSLGGALPNPFREGTRITYTLAVPGRTVLRLYDCQGRLMRTLMKGLESPGAHSLFWTGEDDTGQRLPAGVYYYGLGGQSREATGRVVMLK